MVEARLRPTLDELPDGAELPPIFPFTDEQVIRIARTEPTLRDMLQQFRHLFDHVVFGGDERNAVAARATPVGYLMPEENEKEPATAIDEASTAFVGRAGDVSPLVDLTSSNDVPIDRRSRTPPARRDPLRFSRRDVGPGTCAWLGASWNRKAR